MAVSRRELIAGVGAAALAATVTPSAMAEAAKAIHVKPLPAWQVGTPGEMNWHVFFAETEAEALEAFKDWESIDQEDDQPWLEANRQPKFDNPINAEPDDLLKYRAGWTVWCDRCGNEASRDGCSHIVIDKVVCEDCLTLDDYKICDPEYYAEMIELAATDD
jgi:hypothetical protein